MPCVAAGNGGALVIVGATDPAPIVMLKFCTAAGLAPLDAVIVPLNCPATDGVPDKRPVTLLSANPVGNTPDVSENVGTGPPVATNEWLYEAPMLPGTGSALVMVGGTGGGRNRKIIGKARCSA